MVFSTKSFGDIHGSITSLECVAKQLILPHVCTSNYGGDYVLDVFYSSNKSLIAIQFILQVNASIHYDQFLNHASKRTKNDRNHLLLSISL